MNYVTHWDVHVLFVALVCAVLGSAGAASPRTTEFALAILAVMMLFPVGMLLVKAHDERDDRRRQAQYLSSNLLAVLLIATCAFIARHLLNQ